MYTNHLIQEKSPYLLQHAHNPVDWYPWGQEAFERAEKEDKPIFLSIGYSTCHWCHVMERESFEDPEVAGVLNSSYISIKVDREERPDVDGVYMEACQMMNESGGWPLTVLMTARQEPFFVGTYFPKEDRYGQAGLLHLLEQAAKKWRQDSGRLKELASEMTGYLNQQRQGRTSEDFPGEELLLKGAGQLQRSFDRAYGGFFGAPKFPIPHNLLFLMRMAKGDWGKEEGAGTKCREGWMELVEATLRQMYRGGIFDHIGGGFSRYSTDEAWLVPHFEKMLYDNALLALVYMECWRLTKTRLYRQAAERTLSYMERELRHEKGGFFCGQDADSQGEEGKYYVFTPEEILGQLGKKEGNHFCSCYDITKQGNFEGKSIPNLLQNSDYEEAFDQWEEILKKLRTYRKGRTLLPVDDKILTSWNGLAIWAFARAHQITGVTEYYKRAKQAAAFVRANLMTLNGRLLVRWREGQAANEGNLDDYAFYAYSLLELYQCDFDITWLRTCLQLSEKMLELFEDTKEGGCFFSGTAGEKLIYRPKETYDGAVPSGNAVVGYLLARLAKLTGEPFWQAAARRQIQFLKGEIKGREGGHTMALLAIGEWEEESVHLVCVSREEIPEEEIRCYRNSQTETVDALVITEKNQKSMARLIPQAANYPLQEEILYYICKGECCRPPVSELTGNHKRG